MEEMLLGLGSFTMFGLYMMRRAKHVQNAVCVFHTAASPGIEGHVEMRAIVVALALAPLVARASWSAPARSRALATSAWPFMLAYMRAE